MRIGVCRQRIAWRICVFVVCGFIAYLVRIPNPEKLAPDSDRFGWVITRFLAVFAFETSIDGLTLMVNHSN